MRRFIVTSLQTQSSRIEDSSLSTTVIAARPRLRSPPPSSPCSGDEGGASKRRRFPIRYLATFILAIAAFLFALTPFLTTPANSETSRETFTVAAHVPARVELKRIAGLQTLVITTQDVRTGYKDAVLHYRVTTNAPDGSILRFSPMIGLTKSIAITGLSQHIEIHEDEVEIAKTSAGAFSIHVRFNLKDNVPPGTYPVPLVLSASTFPEASKVPPDLVPAQ